MWARIENAAVAETTDVDPTGKFHPSLIWVPCPADAKPGWGYEGDKFQASPSDVNALYQAQGQRISLACETAVAGSSDAEFKAQMWQKANELKRQLDLALAAGDMASLQAVTWDDEQ
ncbi:hypothetical protein PSCICO_14940 [Pseudomonas cichorii]|uniref:hypothetical protein n=1 Tax=Pseudomonas cichorii TaxID=36746 RepID=UPI00190FF0FC|nr:hypothetical protein [Pseudomonas cichorii]GFM86095.1 hypothetical protein PSCICO_14940 [Pseudomonas cichorii]